MGLNFVTEALESIRVLSSRPVIKCSQNMRFEGIHVEFGEGSKAGKSCIEFVPSLNLSKLLSGCHRFCTPLFKCCWKHSC
ncbi:unnamed protein product [Larinioides sclopetarius]|uniref:Uncharacterized protein n=1 Tax=Larinioides sclopetarius TaxID=280406 RepID=A0AAV2BTC8_9ARAC